MASEQPSRQAEDSRAYPGPPVISIAGAAFSADGKLLLTSYRIKTDVPPARRKAEKRLVLWEVESGKKLWTAEAGEELRPVGFLPDAKTVILLGDTSLQVWNVEHGKLLRTFAEVKLPRHWTKSATLSADGKVVLTNDPETLRLWDVPSGKMVRAFGKSKPSSNAAVSPDGKRALSLSGSSLKPPAASVNLWDVTTGRLIRSFERSGWGGQITFSPDGKFAMTGRSDLISEKRNGKDKSVRKHYLILWEVESGKEVQRFPGYADSLAFTPDGKRLVAVNAYGLNVWEITSGRVLWNIQAGAADTGFAMSPDGKVAFTGSGEYIVGTGKAIKLKLWNLVKPHRARQLAGSLDRWRLERLRLVEAD